MQRRPSPPVKAGFDEFYPAEFDHQVRRRLLLTGSAEVANAIVHDRADRAAAAGSYRARDVGATVDVTVSNGRVVSSTEVVAVCRFCSGTCRTIGVVRVVA